MSSDPNWDLYRTFLAVLRDGSLSSAARSLGLTQPTITRHIDALEAALGHSLFVRSPRGLSPTDAAQTLAPFAETIESTAAALLRAASGLGGAVTGTVRVSASQIVGAVQLPPILAALRRRHPGLTIELVTSNAVDDLLRREADVAVRMVPPTQAALIARRLGSIPLGLYAHRDYLDRHGTPTTLEAAIGCDLIGFDRETPALRAMMARAPALQRSAFALRTDNDVAQLAALRAGYGLGVCQVPIGDADPMLVRVLPDDFELPLEVWVVMHEDLAQSPPVRATFDALVEGLLPLVR